MLEPVLVEVTADKVSGAPVVVIDAPPVPAAAPPAPPEPVPVVFVLSEEEHAGRQRGEAGDEESMKGVHRNNLSAVLRRRGGFAERALARQERAGARRLALHSPHVALPAMRKATPIEGSVACSFCGTSSQLPRIRPPSPPRGPSVGVSLQDLCSGGPRRRRAQPAGAPAAGALTEG